MKEEAFRDWPVRDAGRDPLVFEGVAEPIRIIPSVGEQPVRGRQADRQNRRTGAIADLAGRHEEPARADPGLGDGMRPGVHAAPGSANRASTPPFFERRLDAVRWAFRYVAS
ncbi:MAG: hypothetical protein Kow0013_29540 [Pararhodobacter sp.]